MTDAPARGTLVPRTIALVGLAGMIVLAGFAFAGFTYESGDRVYRFFLAEAIVGAVTTAAAIWWVARARPKGGAIAVLVVSILINPIWFMLLIRMLG